CEIKSESDEWRQQQRRGEPDAANCAPGSQLKTLPHSIAWRLLMFDVHTARRRRPWHVRVSRRAIGIARNFREALAESQEVSCLEHTTGKPLRPVYKLMGDPRNVAHAKKVTQEKQHKAKHSQTTRAPQPGKKAQIEETKSAATEQSTAPKPEAEKPAQPPDSSKLEKSLVVLSNLKDLEF